MSEEWLRVHREGSQEAAAAQVLSLHRATEATCQPALDNRERARKHAWDRQATGAKNPKAQAIKFMHLTGEDPRDLAGNTLPQQVRHVFITWCHRREENSKEEERLER